MKKMIHYLVANLRIGEEKATEELREFASRESYTGGALEMFDGKVLYASGEFGIREISRPELVMCFALHTLFDRHMDPNVWRKESEFLHYIYNKTEEDIEVCVAEDGWTTEQVIELLEGID